MVHQFRGNGETFNSRPHMEVDGAKGSGAGRAKAFQLTTSHGGRLIPILVRAQNVPFNSRPHMEVDNCAISSSEISRTFQLTTSHGGRLSGLHSLAALRAFQLTTSHGGRQQISLFFHRVRIFFINLYTNNTLYFLLCIILLLFSPLLFHFIGANPKTFPVRCAFALEQQRLRHVKAWLYSHVLHFIFISIP